MTDTGVADTYEPVTELTQLPPSTVVPFPAPPKPPSSAPENEFSAAAIAKAAPVNEFSADAIKGAQETRARASVISAQGGNPDAAAKALALSKKTGVPADVIEADPRPAQERVAINEFSAAAPGMKRWLSEDPINARLASDDMAGLASMEAAYRKLAQTKTPTESGDWEATVLPQPGGIMYGSTDKPGKAAPLWQSQIQSGIESTAATVLNLEKIATINTLKELEDIRKGVPPTAGPKSLYRSMTPEQRDQITQQLSAKVIKLADQIGQSKEYDAALPVNPAVKSFSTAADAVEAGNMAGVLRSALDTVTRDIVSSRALGDTMPEREGPSAGPGGQQLRKLAEAFMEDPLGLIQHGFFTNLSSVGAAVIGGAVGGPVGAAVGGVLSDFPSRLDDVLTDRMRDIGVNVDDQQEVVQYLRWNPEFIIDAVKSAGMGSLTVGAADAVLQRLVRPLKAGTGVARNVGVATGNFATGVGTEMAGEAAARVAADQPASLNEVLMEGIGAAGVVAGHTAVETVKEARHARAEDKQKEDVKKAKDAIVGASKVLGDLEGHVAENGAKGLDDLIDKAAATKLAGRSPEKLAEFLSTVTGPDQNVFVPVEAVQAYFQSKPVEDMQAMSDALGITDQIPEALARGGDVVIPLAKYVTEAGKSDIHKAWRENVRLEADGFSIRQAQEDAKVRDERLKSAVDRFEKQLDAGIAEVDATTRVYEDLRDKLKTAGKFTNGAAEQQAAVFAEHYATRAQRNPGSYSDAWDAYSKAGLGTGMEVRSQLSDRVGAYPPDDLDVLLNSIRSGKVAPTKTDANANAQFLKDREELAGALGSMGVDPKKMGNAQIRAAIKAELEKRKTGGQTYEQNARGQITFAENLSTITLFQGRDLSTLLHETGHLWLEELGFDAKAATATPQIKADYQAVLDALGSKDGYLTRDMHEQFAQWAEQYFMEGKAPSAGLASAFRSFKRWLTQIYRRLTALGAPITPELRQVFDRLIATDEQIANAQTRQGLNPVFKDAESADMTKAEFAAYTARANAVVDDAEHKLLQSTMDTIRKQRTKEWKADEARVREEVTGEVMSESGQQALALLTKGEFPVGTTPEVLKGIKLTKEDIVSLYGDETVLAMLPAGIYRDRSVGPGTMSPDELAPMLGLDSGKELIERLMQLEAQHKAMAGKGDKRSVSRAKIDEETAQRMSERHGDPLNDGTIEQEAMAAVHSDKQAALMATELRVLAKKAGHTGTITWDDIKTWAADAIADKSVREGTRFDQYARAEREAGKKVERALIKGDFVAAFKAKQDQMVNHALFMEARKASEDVDAARKLMDRYASAETIKSMDQDYLDQIHKLLEQYEFKNRSATFLAERKSYEAWAIEQEAKGVEVIPPPRLDKGLFTTNYRDLTVDEMRGLSDTVKQIAHLGRTKKELLDAGKKREFEAVIAEAVSGIQAIPQRGVSNVRRGLTNLQAKIGDVGSWFRSADAALLKMETVFEWLGPTFHRVIFNRMSEAQTKERDLQHALNTKLTEIHGKVPIEQRKRWVDVMTLPELGAKLNRSQLIAVALNTGNEGNFDKLARGEKWAPDAVEAVLNKHLTKEEWQFVQDAWDLINTLWPEAEAMERRVNGVAPPKVEPREVTTPFGKLKGGYYPAVYDPKASVEADKIGAMKAEGLFDPAYRKATTRAGSTKKRTGAAYPMLLSLQVIGQHLNEVSHDIAFREAVMDAYRFLTDKRIKEAVNEALGPEYSKQFEPWVKNIANEWAINRTGNEGIEAFMNGLRTNVTAVGMGFRLSTMLSQITGFANTAQKLGMAKTTKGLMAFLKNPADAVRTVHAKSGEMRHRMNDLDRDIRAALQRIEGKSGFKADVQRFAFRGIALFDAAVTVPTWIGAHTEGLRQGMTDADAAFYADKMVRDTQGAGSAKDLAAIQRGGPLMKLFTMFYSYFNVFYNRQRGLVRDARDIHSVGDAMDVLAQSFWLLIVPSLLAPLLSGQGPGDDEEWGTWVARNLFFGLFSGVPYVRDATNTVSNLVGGRGDFGGTKLSPVQTFWDTAIHTGKDVAHLVQGEDVSPTAIKSAFNMGGLLTGLPTGQVGATSQFLWDALVTGSQNPETLKDWLSGLTYGPERKK